MRYLLVLVFLFLASCAGMQRNLDVAPVGTQSIVMWHKPSGERISVTYRLGGHYVPEAFNEIDHLFRDRHTGEEYPIDPALIDVIADMRDKMIMDPATPIELTSGYRSTESNDKLRTINRYAAKNSYHTKGQAADIRIPGMIPSVLELVAKTMQRGGVALYPDSGHVHVDVGPVRGWEVKRGREDGAPTAREIRQQRSAAPPATIVRSRGTPSATPTLVKKPYVPSAPVLTRTGKVPVTVKKPVLIKKPAPVSGLGKPSASPARAPAVKTTKTPTKTLAKTPAKVPAKTPARAAKGKIKPKKTGARPPE